MDSKYALCLFLLVVAVFSGCSVSRQGYTGSSITGNAVASDAPKKFTILYEGGRYSPDEITAGLGSVVMIDFVDKTNSTSLFIIDGYAEESVVNGKTRFFFTADRTGVFDYGIKESRSRGKLKII